MERVNRTIGDTADRRAWFVAALCLAWPDGHAETFVGRVDGLAIWPPRGNNGFGYDPMFVPAGQTVTFGELTSADKYVISHRARAFTQFQAACFVHPYRRHLRSGNPYKFGGRGLEHVVR